MSQVVTVGELDKAAVGYLVHLQRKAQPNTVVSYRESIDKFLTFAGERGVRDFAGVTRVLVEGWQDYLAITPTKLTKKPLAPRSRNVAASAVRMFFLWSAKVEMCDAKLALWLDEVKTPDLEPRPLDRTSMLLLKVYFLADTGTPDYLRDRALFNYLVGTAARVAEGLRAPRVGWERCTVIQKGGGPKTMICPDFAADAMRAYLATRIDSNPALWVRRAGKVDAVALNPTYIRRIWTRIAKEIGIPRFTTHQLRHTAATAMLAAGVDSGTVTNFMGHKSPATLKIYAKVPEAQRQLAAATMNHVLSTA